MIITSTTMLLLVYYLIPFLFTLAAANVEKTIFIAPSPLTIPTIDPTLDDLGLERLSPLDGMLRTRLNASFPTPDSPGTDSWYFLENLTPGQRYEVRICWLATQPTAFTLTTYSLLDIVEDTSLLSALSIYSSSRLTTAQPVFNRHGSSAADPAPTKDSVLFLRVTATADYFSLDPSLMETVPPVMVDIILDPFLGNVFPRSLVPTACWVGVVGCVAIVVARWVAGEFGKVVVETVGAHDGGPDRKKEQ